MAKGLSLLSSEGMTKVARGGVVSEEKAYQQPGRGDKASSNSHLVVHGNGNGSGGGGAADSSAGIYTHAGPSWRQGKNR